ncbi:MAG: SIR2 family protein [Bacteroidales bacterium]
MGIKIPENINCFVSEIAYRLWNGHASIMIGAGFSKNAKKTSSTISSIPTWNELGDIFYEKLHAVKPEERDKSYLNVLKLADELEVTFGKEYLNNLIKNVIPDSEYLPSDLHISLMSLPWKDVFTTNYDTLLERSADLIVDRRYEIVTNRHDLVWSTSPRIVKLHGSFPSERPFVISGEDYRQYPLKYAPFVNTVQQSLLENTLCLVGFSGDDPNFLNWMDKR